MQKHQPSFNNMIVTEISEADTFYRAEEYHQQYIKKESSNKIITIDIYSDTICRGVILDMQSLTKHCNIFMM